MRRVALPCGLAICASAVGVRGTQDAIANGETRTLDLYHAHTRESLRITFKSNGFYDRGALEKLNWFLRDWRRDEPISMAPGLFDIVWFAYRESGASEPIKVVSAYRAPSTNDMLRRRSRAVAKESQHMRGNAMDFHIPGTSMARVREIAMKLQRGGVGYYPTAGSPFVHLDVGTVRSWPRMTREQLLRVFPDEKTVHLPADGVPLANYQSALTEVQARGGTALDYDTVRFSGKSLWALLFGPGDEDAADPSRVQVAARGRGRGRNQSPPQVAALSPTASGDNVMVVAALAPQVATPAPRAARGRPEQVVRPAPASEPSIAQSVEGVAPIVQAPAEAPARPVPPPAVQIAALSASSASSAALPLPPVRPQGQPVATQIAIAAPLPPIRPAGLTTPAPVVAASADSEPEAEKPAAVPAQIQAAPKLVAGLPLPPTRPALVASAASMPIQTTTLQPASPPIVPPRIDQTSAAEPAPAAAGAVAEALSTSAGPRPVLVAGLPTPPRRAANLPSIVSAAPRPGEIGTGSVAQAFAPAPGLRVQAPADSAEPVEHADQKLGAAPAASEETAAMPFVRFGQPAAQRDAKHPIVAVALQSEAQQPTPPIYGSFAGGFVRKLAPGLFKTGW
jgi:uncharacterized protein YcbK (DUF882 family)